MKKIPWGIIGAGRIAAAFAKAIKYSDIAEAYAVASLNKERGSSFASTWGFSKTYDSYKDLLSDSKVKAVYIATPHMNHSQLAIAALKAGKHVMCEKPAAVNTRELLEIFFWAKKTGCFFMEALWTKFNPTFLQAIKWINEQKIGRLQAIYADFCINSKSESIYPESGYSLDRLYDMNLAGGALLDVGIYPVTAALCAVEASFFAKNVSGVRLFPKSIKASCRKAFSGVDAFDSISLDFGNIQAHLSCAIDTECGPHLKTAKFVGTEGMIFLPYFWMAQRGELYDKEGQLIEVFDSEFEVNGFEYELAEFCRCLQEIENGNKIVESPFHTKKQCLRGIQVLDSIRKKIELTYPFEESKIIIAKGVENIMATETRQQEFNFSGEQEIVIYTDGACSGNPGPGGWGCVVLADGMEYSASGGEVDTTNNRMELSAAIAALSAVFQNEGWKQRQIVVNIDSQYVKNGITSWIKSWKKNGWRNSGKQPVKNKDLWETLDNLNCSLNVSWNWVKGHSGVKYNEICDKLATAEVAKYSCQ